VCRFRRAAAFLGLAAHVFPHLSQTTYRGLSSNTIKRADGADFRLLLHFPKPAEGLTPDFPSWSSENPETRCRKEQTGKMFGRILLPDLTTSLPESLQQTAGDSEKGNRK